MPKFSNGKISSSIIFYNRGIPNSDKSFGTYASMNYSMLKQLAIFNKNSGKPNYSLFY